MNEVTVKPMDAGAEFRARILEKLKTDIASMLPDEALQGLVNESVRQMFFEPRQIQIDNWSSQTKAAPSWFNERVMKLIEPVIAEEAKLYVGKHDTEIREAVRTCLDKDKMLLVTAAAVAEVMRQESYNVSQNILSALRGANVIRS